MELRVMIEPQRGATYEDQLKVTRRAEELGFAALFRSDHFMRFTAEDDAGPGPTDAWVTLAGLARETSRIRLGTMVSSATFRLPGILAVQVAQVDAMSGGRVELGLGAGWFEPEHRAYGVPFPDVGQRFERLEEQLAIITGMWRTPPGELFSYPGRHFVVEGSPALPRPHQQPHPPVVIGGMGRRQTPRLAAAYADEFNAPFAPLEKARQQLERVRDACAKAGRDPSSLVCSVAATLASGRNDHEVKARVAALGLSEDHLRQGPGFVGTPNELVERSKLYEQMGISRLYLQLLDMSDTDQLELVAADVVPYL
jgi:F420-dependent oxidoreductase-like protein